VTLDYDDQEKLLELLNKAFDDRILQHIESSIERHLPIIDELVKRRIDGSGYTPELNDAFQQRIRSIVESAADHHIRLFGGCAALRDIVGKVFEQKAEYYISGEVHRRVKNITDAIAKAAGGEAKK